MINTKRKQNNIIVSFSFYLIWIFVLIFFLFNKVIPDYKEIEELKTATYEIYENKLRVEKNWINLSEFKENLPQEKYEWNLFLTNIINDLNDRFYNEFFINKTSANYNEYIGKLLENYSDRWEFDKNISLISNILPVYSNVNNFWDESSEILKEFVENNDLLSDFKFINYIERLAHTFNISFEDSIWIEELVLLNEYSIWPSWNSMETNIYYIPVELEVSTTKELLLDFLYFVENVWNVTLEWEDLILNTNIANDFASLKNKSIYWDIRVPGYNIFNNMIMDVYAINIWEYPDVLDDLVNNDKSFVDFLKTTQGRQRISAKIELRFYVKWLPSYIIENYINNFIIKFNNVQAELNWKMGDPSINEIKREQLNDINNTMSQLDITLIWNIQKAMSTKVDIEKAYNEAYKYNVVLDDFLDKINN